MPNYQRIREWDGTEATVVVKHVPFSKLSTGCAEVTLTYFDGVMHKVTETYYDSIHIGECCCVCGDHRESVDGWECPGCGSV